MKREVITRRATLVGPFLALLIPCVSAFVIRVAQRMDALDPHYRVDHTEDALYDLAHRKCTQRNWIDPWGMPYAVYCGDGINIAQSFGPDRIPNTSDDIWSNR